MLPRAIAVASVIGTRIAANCTARTRRLITASTPLVPRAARGSAVIAGREHRADHQRAEDGDRDRTGQHGRPADRGGVRRAHEDRGDADRRRSPPAKTAPMIIRTRPTRPAVRRPPSAPGSAGSVPPARQRTRPSRAESRSVSTAAPANGSGPWSNRSCRRYDPVAAQQPEDPLAGRPAEQAARRTSAIIDDQHRLGDHHLRAPGPASRRWPAAGPAPGDAAGPTARSWRTRRAPSRPRPCHRRLRTG